MRRWQKKGGYGERSKGNEADAGKVLEARKVRVKALTGAQEVSDSCDVTMT